MKTKKLHILLVFLLCFVGVQFSYAQRGGKVLKTKYVYKEDFGKDDKPGSRLDGKVEYDSKGKDIKEYNYNKEGKIKDYTVYSYNALGRKESETQYDAKGVMIQKITYSYDAYGNRVMKSYYNKSNKLIKRETYTYEYY